MESAPLNYDHTNCPMYHHRNPIQRRHLGIVLIRFKTLSALSLAFAISSPLICGDKNVPDIHFFTSSFNQLNNV